MKTIKNLLPALLCLIIVNTSFGQSNIAIGKKARQSGDYHKVSLAVDGNPSTFSTAKKQLGAWWEVDLGESFNIYSITVHNRTDCCSERLKNFTIKVSDKPFSSNSDGSTFATDSSYPKIAETYFANKDERGRYIRIYLNGNNYLSLGEVEVFGTPVKAELEEAKILAEFTAARKKAEAEAAKLAAEAARHNNIKTVSSTISESVNIAKGKTAKQSSYLVNDNQNFVASLAIDGNANTAIGGGAVFCTRNEQEPWWEVDLGKSHDIRSIKLYNRTDCCAERLDNFTILVSETPFTSNTGGTVFIADQPAPNGARNYNGNARGRYVRLFLKGTNYLSIPEIEIFEKSSTSRVINFINEGTSRMELKVDGTIIKTLEPFDREQPVEVNIGDEIVIRGKDSEGNEIGFPNIRINEDTQNEIRITPQSPYKIKDERTGLHFEYLTNLKGIDLKKFDPTNIGESIKTGGYVFQGIKSDGYDYYQQKSTNIYLPLGFDNNGSNNEGKGEFSNKTIIGKDKLKESWSVGASSSVSIPVKAFTVTPSIGFNYSQTKIEESSQTDIFIASQERKNLYNLEIIDLGKVKLNPEFRNKVERIKTLEDAREIVKIYGTHYTNNVVYGGVFREYSRVKQSTMFTAAQKGFNITGSVAVSKKGAEMTEKMSAIFSKKTGSTGDSQLGKGAFDIGWSKDEEAYDETKDVENYYEYQGGKGTWGAWDADEKNAVAIGVGDLIPLHNLVYAYIFKSDATDMALELPRLKLKEAIEEHCSKLNEFDVAPPYRSFTYRIKDIKYTTIDDADTRIKGHLNAVVVLGNLHSNLVTKKPELDKDTKQGNKPYLKQQLIDSPDGKGRTKIYDKSKWFTVTQYGSYNGKYSKELGLDPIAVFDPIVIAFSSTEFTDMDGAVVSSYDHLKIEKSTDYLKIDDTIAKEHKIILKHFYSHAEKMTCEVTLEIIPLVGF